MFVSTADLVLLPQCCSKTDGVVRDVKPVQPCATASALCARRLLLATHTRLMWYFPDTHEYQVLHEGEASSPSPQPQQPVQPVLG